MGPRHTLSSTLPHLFRPRTMSLCRTHPPFNTLGNQGRAHRTQTPFSPISCLYSWHSAASKRNPLQKGLPFQNILKVAYFLDLQGFALQTSTRDTIYICPENSRAPLCPSPQVSGTQRGAEVSTTPGVTPTERHQPPFDLSVAFLQVPPAAPAIFPVFKGG